MAERKIPVLHIAGELIDGVQRCVICGHILQDYRGASFTGGQLPKVWSSEGFVAVSGNLMFAADDEFEGQQCKYLIA